VPAAAVTPALIVYIKVVAVKKLVVGFQCLGLWVWAPLVGRKDCFFTGFFLKQVLLSEVSALEGGVCGGGDWGKSIFFLCRRGITQLRSRPYISRCLVAWLGETWVVSGGNGLSL